MLFDKNEYYLFDVVKENTFQNRNQNQLKEDCFEHVLQNNYQGFRYKGDKHKCLLFSNNDLNQKMDIDLKKYNNKRFIKTKNTIDFKMIDEQKDVSNSFLESNHYDSISRDLIDERIVSNREECMNICLESDQNCQSILYSEQPKECIFYHQKKMKKKGKESNEYDTYTVKKKIDNILPINDNVIAIDKESKESKEYKKENNINIPLYECSGKYSTNPFCTNEFDESLYNKKNKKDKIPLYTSCYNIKDGNIDEKKKDYTKMCKKEYGSEYVFDDNIYNMESIIKCDHSLKEKVKCKIEMDNKNLQIETFINKFNQKDSQINTYNLLFLSILLFFFLFNLYFYFYNK